jgi:CBS domain containing-hemolysin-like protein
VTLFYELFGVAVLIVLNAFFVAAEYGLVTARRTRIIELHHQGNRRARDVLRITSSPPQFIAAMQLGVTLTSLGIGALGEAALSHEFEHWVATVLAVLLAYLILTYVHVVLGELVPKGIALGHAEGVALWVAVPVRIFFTIFGPLIWVLRRTTELVLTAFGLEEPGSEVEAVSEAELRMLLTRSTEHGEIEQEERGMIEKVFDFADKDAADVMIPRPEVVALSITLPPEEALRSVIESPYTRYPVYRETLDDVVGILHVRDLFSSSVEQGLANVDIEQLLRPAHVVPETKDLASLLQDFRRTNTHFAIVVDEYGAMAGILTLEDLLEEIVGEIEDEFDVPEEEVEQIDDDTYRVPGMFAIDDFNERFHTDLPEEDFHTVGGFVFGQLGRAPQVGDEVFWDPIRFDVLEVEGNRIEKIGVHFVERPKPRTAEDDLLTASDDEYE